jgi:hypothetical protein
MNIFDTLLGIKLDEDFTDTSWWTDAVFRGLTQEDCASLHELVEGSADVPADEDLGI